MGKRTLIIGASTKTSRYSNMAMRKLIEYKHEVVPIGLRDGEICEIKILKGFPDIGTVHSVAMYINPTIQPAYYDYILKCKPERIIFNPGTYNNELAELAHKNGIETVDGCVLVMLSCGEY
jgi:uncharacterized protein